MMCSGAARDAFQNPSRQDRVMSLDFDKFMNSVLTLRDKRHSQILLI